MAKRKRSLNRNTLQVFDFICKYKKENDGVSPSLSEIAEALCLCRSSAQYYVDRLEACGVICCGVRRGIMVVGGQYIPPDGPVYPGSDNQNACSVT